MKGDTSKMKKTRSIWLSMLLVMIFTASLCTSVYANVDMTLALEKVGEIQEAKLDYIFSLIQSGGGT